MLALASARVTAAGARRDRVTFGAGRMYLDASFPPRSYDALVTLFFLDCLTADQVATIVGRASVRTRRAGGRWLFADFAVPAHGRGLRSARPALDSRCSFASFNWRAALARGRSTLPPSEEILLGTRTMQGFGPGISGRPPAQRRFRFARRRNPIVGLRGRKLRPSALETCEQRAHRPLGCRFWPWWTAVASETPAADARITRYPDFPSRFRGTATGHRPEGLL